MWSHSSGRNEGAVEKEIEGDGMVRRSKYQEMIGRLRRLRRKIFKGRIEPPWICPYCFGERMRYIEKKPLVFIHCPDCDRGEVMPLHPVWRKVDYYCFLVDNVLKGAQPIFKFDRMDFDTYMFVNRAITLGKLEVREIIQKR